MCVRTRVCASVCLRVRARVCVCVPVCARKAWRSWSLTWPLQVGVVGGTIKSHPTAKAALAMLDVSGAQELGEVC